MDYDESIEKIGDIALFFGKDTLIIDPKGLLSVMLDEKLDHKYIQILKICISSSPELLERVLKCDNPIEVLGLVKKLSNKTLANTTYLYDTLYVIRSGLEYDEDNFFYGLTNNSLYYMIDALSIGVIPKVSDDGDSVDFSNDRQNIRIGIKDFGDEHFTGILVNGEPSGRGRSVFEKTGSCYIGDYLRGCRTGMGEYVFGKNTKYYGDRYCGEFLNGDRHGHGTYYYANGSRFEGEWSNNRKNGHGKLYYTDGKVYEGEWTNSKKNGPGIMHLPDGTQ